MFRKDIQALRAFAVATVVAFHAGLPVFAAGFIGVDVFFVISGFLIIGLLTKEFERSGKIDLLAFLGRRARRLIPAASIVLVVTSLAVLWFLPGRRGDAAFVDIASASFYIANLRFAHIAMDYWSPTTVSPIVHYWSLGVEEQFYVMFPIALVLIVLLTRKSRMKIIELLLGAIVVVSFVLMMRAMSGGSAWGFYSPLTRAWEFAIGGLAATVGRPYVLRSEKAREVLAWLCVGTLSYCVVFYDPKAAFPGVSAIAPVVATALLLWNGSTDYQPGSLFSRVVSVRPLQALGTWSYSTYLWHWPVLYFGAMAFQADALSPEQLNAPLALILIALSIAFAALTNKFIENPVRNHPALKASVVKSLAVGLALSTAVTSLAFGLKQTNFQHLSSRPVIANPSPTAVAVANEKSMATLIEKYAPKLVDSDQKQIELAKVTQAATDLPATVANGCHLEDSATSLPVNCYFGDVKSKNLIVVFGNSHTNQFFGPIDVAVKKLKIKMLHRTRSGCNVLDVDTMHQGVLWKSCIKWRKAVVKEILKLHPSSVVMVGGIPNGGEVRDPATGQAATKALKRELNVAGLRSTVKKFSDAGIKVLFIRDTPEMLADPLDCLASHTVPACTQPMAHTLDPTSINIDVVKDLPLVTTVDLTLALCQPATCAPVRGGEIVWRDNQHVTNSYAMKLAPLFKALLKPLVAPAVTPTQTPAL